MVQLFKVPGVSEIENRVVLNELTGTKVDHDLDRKVAKVIRDVFGIEGRPEDYFEWAYLDTGETDDDMLRDIEHWSRAGWDIVDSNGKELRCFGLFEAAMVCVTEGYAGSSIIEIDAVIWRQDKSASAALPPRLKAQNQNFLALGQPKRKPAA